MCYNFLAGDFLDNLVKIGKNIYINDYEISILKKCNIDVNSCKTIDEVLLLIDRFLGDNLQIDEEEYDEIDYVANNLSERKYYWDTFK